MPHYTQRKGKRCCYDTSMDVIRKRPGAELRGPQRLPGAMVEGKRDVDHLLPLMT